MLTSFTGCTKFRETTRDFQKPPQYSDSSDAASIVNNKESWSEWTSRQWNENSQKWIVGTVVAVAAVAAAVVIYKKLWHKKEELQEEVSIETTQATQVENQNLNNHENNIPNNIDNGAGQVEVEENQVDQTQVNDFGRSDIPTSSRLTRDFEEQDRNSKEEEDVSEVAGNTAENNIQNLVIVSEVIADIPQPQPQTTDVETQTPLLQDQQLVAENQQLIEVENRQLQQLVQLAKVQRQVEAADVEAADKKLEEVEQLAVENRQLQQLVQLAKVQRQVEAADVEAADKKLEEVEQLAAENQQLQKQNTEIASELSRSRHLFVGHFSKIHAKEIENAIFDSSSVPEDFEDNWSTAL